MSLSNGTTAHRRSKAERLAVENPTEVLVTVAPAAGVPTGERIKRSITLSDPTLSAFGDMFLEIEGVTPLIMHRFSKKAEILSKQTGKAVGKKAPKDVEKDFLDALYVIGERPTSMADLPNTKFGMPAIWFKCAAIRGAKMNDFTMTDARTAFFVDATHGDLIELDTPALPIQREDPVRVANSTVDIRIRPMFERWSAKLSVHYNARMVSAENLVSWFIAAGSCNGVGEWRPGGRMSSGVYGCFRIVRADVVEPKLSGK